MVASLSVCIHGLCSSMSCGVKYSEIYNSVKLVKRHVAVMHMCNYISAPRVGAPGM